MQIVVLCLSSNGKVETLPQNSQVFLLLASCSKSVPSSSSLLLIWVRREHLNRYKSVSYEWRFGSGREIPSTGLHGWEKPFIGAGLAILTSHPTVPLHLLNHLLLFLLLLFDRLPPGMDPAC